MIPVVPPLQRGDHGPAVTNLTDVLALLVDRGAIRALTDPNRPTAAELSGLVVKVRSEGAQAEFGDATRQLVRYFQLQHRLGDTLGGLVETTTADSLNATLTTLGVLTSLPDGAVSGRIYSADRPGVDDLRVQLVDRSVGADTPLAETTTDADGGYAVTYPQTLVTQRGKSAPDLQVRVLDGATVLGVSAVRYDAAAVETIDVALPVTATGALHSEHDVLAGAIGRLVTGPIKDLREDTDPTGRQDISYIANKTGWDARAVALAVLAERFSADTTVAGGAAPAIAPDLFYALFRAGLPADDTVLYRTDPGAVKDIWTQSIDQGVIATSFTPVLDTAVRAWRELRNRAVLTAPAPAAVSPLADMLAVSGLPDAQQQSFAAAYTEHRDDPSALWAAVAQTAGQDTAARLQVDGKLAFLTLNNAALMKAVHSGAGTGGITDPGQLVSLGYHHAETWRSALTADTPIPPTIPGDTAEHRQANYAEFLAAAVRLSYPTAVVAALVKSGGIPLASPDDVHDFLDAQQGRFDIATQPVERFIADHRLDVAPATVTEIKRLQRIYQITPDDTAMSALLRRGYGAAQQIARTDRATFVAGIADDVGGTGPAGLIYDRSRQILGATLNIALSYLASRTGIALGTTPNPADAPAGGQVLQPMPRTLADDGAVTAYPTLDSLLGSPDFCACDDCRSVLSPAAYLVDLLQFLDHDPTPAESAAGIVNPQQVLLQRRPDLQHLPLTCENTNTALPYIDIVNETLEYSVANGTQPLSLRDYTGHDTDGATAEDLLAGPPHVLEAAYPILAAEPYPAPLPFDRSLANLRELFSAFGIPLDTAMERLRVTDDLDGPADTVDWRDILIERLGLSPAEYRILTDSTAVPVARMYGFPATTSDTDVIAALSTCGLYVRRAGVSYDDLVAILAAHFVNPDGAITLVDPDPDPSGTDFGSLEFRQNGTRLGAAAFLRLIRFIRLQKMLGWTIAQTDAAICALLRTDFGVPLAGDVDTPARLDAGFATLLPRLAVVVGVLDALDATVDTSLGALLSCWADLGTVGENSPYRTMFGNPTLLARDPAFAPDEHGDVLQDQGRLLLDHTETLRAAFSLTAAEFALIVDALGFGVATPLTLPTVSAVYRLGWLARSLRLSVRELTALLGLSGLAPFELPDPAHPDILRLIRLVHAMRDGELPTAAALYLVWNEDVSGTSGPDPVHARELARTLRADMAAVDADFTAAAGAGHNAARALIAQVYGDETADDYFALLDDTVVLDVAYTHATSTLPAAVHAADPAIGYDDFAHRLSHVGLMTSADHDALRALPDTGGEFGAAVDELDTIGRDLCGSFFARHPELRPLYDDYVASSAPADQKRSALLAAFRPDLSDRRKRQQCAQRLSAAVSVDLSATRQLLDPDSARLPLNAAGDPGRPALDDVIAVQTPGLAARFYFGADTGGTADLTVPAVAPVDYAPQNGNPIPANTTAGQPVSGIWSGYLEAPQPGYHNLVVETDTQATVSLEIDGTALTLVHDGAVWRNGAALQLTSGRLYAVTLTVTAVKDRLRLMWETPNRPREVIPGRYLYPDRHLAAFCEVFWRFVKASSLAGRLGLDSAEIAYLATSPAFEVAGRSWLDALPVEAGPDRAAAAALLAPLEALLDYRRVKRALRVDDDRLLGILTDPVGAAADESLFALTRWDRPSLAALTERFGVTVADLSDFRTFGRIHDAFTVSTPLGIPAAALIRAAGNHPDGATVADFEGALRARFAAADWRTVIRPVNDTMRTRRRDALSAYILHQLGGNPATAHIDTADKLFEYFLMDVQMQSCMLTSRIRHALSSVQLFVERCLMNLESGAAALPASAGDRWSWMRRYRMWEANRKVFLWPENWLEPELRDDKSVFFRDAESQLQQCDLTDDSATTVFLDYLGRLEEVAKLEPCAVYYAEPSVNSDAVTHVVARTAGAHRTYYSRRQEYGGWTPWEPVKLDIEDNPVLLTLWRGRLLLFWLRVLKNKPDNGRRPAAHRSLGSLTTDDLPGQSDIEVSAVLCWSEYRNGKWQPAKTSALDRPTMLDTIVVDRYDRSALRIGTATEGDALRVYIKDAPTRFWRRGTGGMFELCQIWPGSFLFYNTHSLPVRGDDDVVYLGVSTDHVGQQPGITLPANMIPPQRRELAGTGDSDFALRYVNTAGADLTRDILRTRLPFELVTPRQQLSDLWESPMFFADSRNAFHITTADRPVWVGGFGGYGLPVAVGGMTTAAIPALVTPAGPPPEPAVWAGADAAVADRDLVDRALSKRLISEDAYIRRALPTTSTVVFGDGVIGPTGSVPRLRAD